MSFYFLSGQVGGVVVLGAVSIYGTILYVSGQLFQRLSGKFRKWAFRGFIFLSLFVLAVFKYPSVTSWTHINIFGWVGLSYLTFRSLDFLIDSYNRRTQDYGLISVVSFLLFFPGFFSGPINAYGSFVSDTKKPLENLTPDQLAKLIFRIALGVVKLAFLAPFIYSLSLLDKGSAGALLDARISTIQVVVSLYAYLLYIYLDFSGYCDAAISIARLLGLQLPENFNLPMLSASPQDFWNRWHVSLSHWCRAHIFFPLTKYLATKQKKISPLGCSMLAIFITFCLVGVWHGEGLNWFLYGALHGIMLAGHIFYRSQMNKKFPEFYRQLQTRLSYRLVCTVLTVSYVAFGLLLIRPLEDAKALLFG